MSNKCGLAEFAQHLSQLGVTIYSTGGTFRALKEAQIRAIPIDELTQFPEMMDGRVKTLHPAVFAGKYWRGAIIKRTWIPSPAHQLTPIDMVVVNLYPFQQVVARPDAEEGRDY